VFRIAPTARRARLPAALVREFLRGGSGDPPRKVALRYYLFLVSFTHRRFTGFHFAGSAGRTLTICSPAFLTSMTPISAVANLSQAPVAETLPSAFWSATSTATPESLVAAQLAETL